MRTTRTLAACIAATTLFGVLSATPATAEQLDGGRASVSQSEQTGGPDSGLPGRPAVSSPERPAPDAPAPEQTPKVTASYSDGVGAVSLRDDGYLTGASRLVVLVDGKVIAQVWGGATLGTAKQSTTSGRWIITSAEVEPGARLEIRKYTGDLWEPVDEAHRGETVIDEQLPSAP